MKFEMKTPFFISLDKDGNIKMDTDNNVESSPSEVVYGIVLRFFVDSDRLGYDKSLELMRIMQPLISNLHKERSFTLDEESVEIGVLTERGQKMYDSIQTICNRWE